MPRSHSLAIAETFAARLLRLFSFEDGRFNPLSERAREFKTAFLLTQKTWENAVNLSKNNRLFESGSRSFT